LAVQHRRDAAAIWEKLADEGNRGRAKRVVVAVDPRVEGQQSPPETSGIFASRRCTGETGMIKKVVGGVTEEVSSITEKVTPIAEKVLETGEATLEETQSLANAVLELDTDQIGKEVSDIAEKVSKGAEATVDETKRLAESVLAQK
jgi:hypothetical protein